MTSRRDVTGMMVRIGEIINGGTFSYFQAKFRAKPSRGELE
jgi:hypothetical protein